MYTISKRFVQAKAFSPSGICGMLHFSLSKFSVFKRFVHDTVDSPSGTSVEFCMLYYSKSRHCETKSDNI